MWDGLVGRVCIRKTGGRSTGYFTVRLSRLNVIFLVIIEFHSAN